MIHYLDQLLELLPPDAAHPSQEDIRIMRDIDGMVSGLRKKLETYLKILERKLVPDLHISHRPSFNAYRDIRYGAPPSVITPEIREGHERRFRILQSFLAFPHILLQGFFNFQTYCIMGA